MIVPPFPSFSLQDGTCTKKRKGGDGIRDAPAPPTYVAIQHIYIYIYIYTAMCVQLEEKKIKSRSAPVALDQDRENKKKKKKKKRELDYKPFRLLPVALQPSTSCDVAVVAPHLTRISRGNR